MKKSQYKVDVKTLRDTTIDAQLLLPNGKAFEDRVFQVRVTKADFVNTVKPGTAWANECGRSLADIVGE
jgi:hypothetical protein